MASILNYINGKFGFRVFINAGYELIAGAKFERYLAGYGCARLHQVKYKYFSDRDLALWELCYAFFDKAHQANVASDREEYLLAKDFNIIFESIIDDLIGDVEVAAFKEMKDGKEIDHLYLDESLTMRGGSTGKTFYIADSKYYKLGNALGDESVYKQFTYAKNMLQLDLHLFLNGDAANEKIRERCASCVGFCFRSPTRSRACCAFARKATWVASGRGTRSSTRIRNFQKWNFRRDNFTTFGMWMRCDAVEKIGRDVLDGLRGGLRPLLRPLCLFAPR